MTLILTNFKTPKLVNGSVMHARDIVNGPFSRNSWEFYRAPTTFRLPVTWYISNAGADFWGSTARTLTGYLLIRRLTDAYFPGFFLAVNFSSSKTIILTIRTAYLLPLLNFFKNSGFFNLLTLTDLWATDFPARRNRFELTYSLLSNKKNMRIYVKTFVNEWEFVPSVTQLFESAAWLEREVWDMFGVVFSGHTDLRRILTDYGFFGFPLRKDFPLTGFSELRYDDTTRRVASEHLNLIQELRLFFFGTPWKNK